MALALGGRLLTESEAWALNVLAAVSTVADPRIWPLKLARVVASYGGYLPGLAAAQLPLEGDRIGPPIVVHAAALLRDLRLAVGDRLEDQQACAAAARDLLASRRRLVGFGIPLRPTDERYAALCETLRGTYRVQLPHWRVQEVLTRVVVAERGLQPNLAIGAAALLLDVGLDPMQTSAMFNALMMHVFMANAFEGARDARPVLQKLPASSIRYVGAPPRRSPRSLPESDLR